MIDTYTSTGAKFFAHQEAMQSLRGGKGRPVVTHVMLTDVCNHTCAFCSVQKRAGDSLPRFIVEQYIDTLLRYGLKAVILSGGGNPILYKCKDTGWNFNGVVDFLHDRGLEIGLITNGMPLTEYTQNSKCERRKSWKGIPPKTLDKLTWIRISMAGLDHKEREVYVPDINHSKTTLGFSYVAHDIYYEPADPYHGKVSTQKDLIYGSRPPNEPFEARICNLTDMLFAYAATHGPRYIRLLPNCLEPNLINRRCKQLQTMADIINTELGYDCVFVQNKPPAPPRACYLGYVHPVLNCDGWVYPCDSCVLNADADHQFASQWRICKWNEIGGMYERPVGSLIADPAKTCPGCVFTRSNEILHGVVDGTADLTPPLIAPEHVNFV